jgi:hypothetical protein
MIVVCNQATFFTPKFVTLKRSEIHETDASCELLKRGDGRNNLKQVTGACGNRGA